MTDISLSYESDVITRSVYGSARRVLPLRPRSGTPMTPRTTTLDVDVCRREEQTDRQRAAWMAAAQVGDRVAYERLLHDCIPFIRRGIPTIRTGHSQRGSGPSRSGAPLTDCAAPPERGRAKFMNRSPM